jgi:hypothetical protein
VYDVHCSDGRSGVVVFEYFGKSFCFMYNSVESTEEKYWLMEEATENVDPDEESVKTRVKWALLALKKTDTASAEADISTGSIDEGPKGSSVFGVRAVKMRPNLLTEESGQYGVRCFRRLTLQRFPSSKHFYLAVLPSAYEQNNSAPLTRCD